MSRTYDEVRESIMAAKRECREAAKIGSRYIRDRGVELYFLKGDGKGRTDDDPWQWDGTKEDMIAMAEVAQAKNLTHIGVGGGFNGADSVYAYANDDYTPEVEVWDIPDIRIVDILEWKKCGECGKPLDDARDGENAAVCKYCQIRNS